MPVMSREHHARLIRELRGRFANIESLFDGRDLVTPKEGVGGRGSWVHPDGKCATVGSKGELSLAVEDFKNILAEIKKLK